MRAVGGKALSYAGFVLSHQTNTNSTTSTSTSISTSTTTLAYCRRKPNRGKESDTRKASSFKRLPQLTLSRPQPITPASSATGGCAFQLRIGFCGTQTPSRNDSPCLLIGHIFSAFDFQRSERSACSRRDDRGVLLSTASQESYNRLKKTMGNKATVAPLRVKMDVGCANFCMTRTNLWLP